MRWNRRAIAVVMVSLLALARAGAEEAETVDCLPADLKLRLAFAEPKRLVDALSRIAKLKEAADQRAELAGMLAEAGCDEIEQQSDSSLREPNLLCRIGDGARHSIVVGTSPLLDGWMTAAILPALASALKSDARRHQFVLVAFGRSSLLQPRGARVFLEQERHPPKAFVHLAQIGLDPPLIGPETSEQQRCLVQSVGRAIGLEVGALPSWDRVALGCDDRRGRCAAYEDSRSLDTYPFRKRAVEIVGLYGIREQRGLASAAQAPRLDPALFVLSYRLAAAYLVALDATP
jgi:hypothetical protein